MGHQVPFTVKGGGGGGGGIEKKKEKKVGDVKVRHRNR